MPNQGLLAIAFLEAAAFLILLVLYSLLARDLRARFFHLWQVGWGLFTVYGVVQILWIFKGGPTLHVVMQECFLASLAFFLAAVLDYTGSGHLLRGLWPLGALGLLLVGILDTHAGGRESTAGWITAGFASIVLLAAGWRMWRHALGKSGYGAQLLAASLLLGGLHGIDQPDWASQAAYLLRVAFGNLTEVAFGIAMAVLVLESSRARVEDLSEKLRGLTLITTASAQTINVDEVLSEALNHLVESLGVSHGLVRLVTGEGASAELVLRASVGFSKAFLKDHARLSTREPWARKVLEQQTAFLSYDGESDPRVRARMEAEGIAAMVLVRLPGKEAPLGVMAVATTTPRHFEPDEINFLVNVANLLGLTVQNVALLAQADTAQRQWKDTFDSMGDPILVHDDQGRVLRANARLADKLGKTAQALVGRCLSEVIRHDAQKWTRCPYCEGAAGEGDDPDPCLGGYFLASTSDFHNPGGDRLGVVHVLKDISERKRAEEKYRTLIENLQEGMFISTPEGRFLDFNDSFQRMLGYERREDLLNVEIAGSIYVNAADRGRLKKLLREHGSVADFELQMRRRDGGVLTVLETSFATRDAAGTVIAYQGFVLDITERKHAEQEIRRRNRELMVLNSIGQTLGQALSLPELLARALHQVIELFAVDIGAIYLFDEKAGVSRRVASAGLHSEYDAYVPPSPLPTELLNHIRAVRATVLSGQSLPLAPVFRGLHQKEGIEDSHVVVLWSKDRILGGLIVASRTLRDFSGAELNLLTSVGSQIAAAIEKTLLYEETRQAYDDLRRTQQQLLQSEKMAAVGQLISGVAHELNNPLTAILGYSQLLAASDHVSPRGSEYVDKIYKQAQRTHRIVHNLLSFARQQKPERLPVSLNQVIEDTLALREYDLRVNNIRVQRDLAPDLPLTSADAHQLQQVFLNILNNAVDAILQTQTPGEVWVRTGVTKDQLLVEFTDSGAGVLDTLRIFDPFYTTKPVGKGTGLGLSICYGIVTEHGGEISVCNSPPRGATFTITLPILPIAEMRSPNAAGAGESPLCGRVLLVDDEEAVLELEQEILNGRCAYVRAVDNGRDAQQALEEESFDLVVTDVKMPGEMSGHELYRWICRHHPELSGRVVFTMSDARPEEVDALVTESGCPLIQKPFEVDEFLSVVRKVWGGTTSALKR